MEYKNLVTSPGKSGVSRRQFLERSASAAVAFSILPRHVLGGQGYVPPSDKVNIAFIGVGAQGFRVMLAFLKQPDVQGVAVCDPNQGSGDYPQWDDHEFRNSVRTLLGVDSGWDWLSPEQPIQLTHSLRVTGGMAGREPSQKVDCGTGFTPKGGLSDRVKAVCGTGFSSEPGLWDWLSSRLVIF